MTLQTSAQHHPAVAQEIRLRLGYDPAPLFTGGSLASVTSELLERVKAARRTGQDERRAIAQRIAARLRQR